MFNWFRKRKLPSFKYHPDPQATGFVEPSGRRCVSCRTSPGYIYTGPVYAEEEYDRQICPWCIADGKAHARLGVTFHDAEEIPGWSFFDAPQVPEAVVEEITQRTPGFAAWQQEQWATCCDDGAAFIGHAGTQDLTARWPDAIESIQQSTGLDGAEWESLFNALTRHGSPTALVFRCLHCGQHLAYQDAE